MKTLSLILLTMFLTACAVGPQTTRAQPPRMPMDIAGKSLPEKQRDFLECDAQAAQRAQSAGAWTSVAPVRAAIADKARDDYLAQCLLSRGWHWNR